jgi:hypothetical protein
MDITFINLNDPESIKSVPTNDLLQALANLFDTLPVATFLRCTEETFEPVLSELLTHTCDTEHLRDRLHFYVTALTLQQQTALLAKEMSEKYPVV